MLFTPLLGVTLLPNALKQHHERKGWFARGFHYALIAATRWKWLTIAVTLITFGASIYGMKFVEQQFFPSSDRPELIVDWNLPQNASIHETDAEMARFEKDMLLNNPQVDHWATYVGQGAPRFVLSFDVQVGDASYGQTVILTKGLAVRDKLRTQLQDYLTRTFPGTDAYVKLLDIGPPVGRPVQYRVSGPDIGQVRALAQNVAAIVATDQNLAEPVYDWMEPARVLKVQVLQDKARQLGVSSQDIANSINGVVTGTTVTQVRDDIYLIGVVARAEAGERGSISTLRNLQLTGTGGQSVPLAAVAQFGYTLEQPKIWRRSRLPTVTVQAAMRGPVQPATAVAELQPKIAALQAKLPIGYAIVAGGSVEESAKAQGPIAAVAPIMLFIMATILMIQLQSFQRLFLVFAVAPLALIGVVAALLPSRAPLGFVAILGVLALIGILIRNSVILIIQIEDLLKEGRQPWDAVIEATEHRMRPILLTAAAATLALIPISREIFWGPMAYAMMGGIVVGTVLTLLFLPALYIAWFRVKPAPATRP